MQSTFPHPARRRASLPQAIAAAALCAAAGLAQRPLTDPTMLDETAAPIVDQGLRPDGSQAGIWANGRNYKVSFHDGMTFYPHVGPALAHQPLHWRTASVTVGGRELLDAATAPQPRFDGFVCDYDLGAIVERYEVRTGGLEQSFVLARNPGSGDLLIRGAVDTPLQLPNATAKPQALTLRLDDGRSVITYGEATAIDASGRKTAVATSCADGCITLRLDGDFLAAASYPLVVDPMLNNTLLENGAPVSGCDVLHESLTPLNLQARTWVVYSRDIAANDSDLWLKRMGSNFGGTPVEVYREISLWAADHGRIALCPASNRTVTVFSTGPHLVPNNIQSFVGTHLHDVTDVNLRTSFATPFAAPVQWDWRPDVGGRTDTGSPNVLIVFQRDAGTSWSNTANSAVYAGILDTSVGTQGAAVGSEFVLRNHPNQDQERPAINHSAEGGAWLVAYQENDGQVANDDWDIPVLRVTGAGAVSATHLDLQEEPTQLLHKLAPHLAGSNGRYLITYATQLFQLTNPKPQDAAGERIRAQRIDWDPSTGGSRPYGSVVLDTDPNPRLTAGGVAFDFVNDSLWCATVTNASAQTISAYKLGFHGGVTEIGTAGPFTGIDLAVGGVDFNDSQREFDIVFAGNDASAAGNALCGVQMVYDTVPAPATYGFACGSGVWGSTSVLSQRQQVGSQGMPLELQNAPVDGIAFLLLSFGHAQIPMGGYGIPGCDLLIDPNPSSYLGLLVTGVTGGASTQRLDLIESLPPLTFYAQWAYLAPGANPAGILASEGLRVQIGH